MAAVETFATALYNCVCNRSGRGPVYSFAGKRLQRTGVQVCDEIGTLPMPLVHIFSIF